MNTVDKTPLQQPAQDLGAAMQLLAEQGLVAVPRGMSVREFVALGFASESEVRHNPQKYRHLMVTTPVRKVVFNAARVLQGINSGNLTNRN
jgi:hypothetical protein